MTIKQRNNIIFIIISVHLLVILILVAIPCIFALTQEKEITDYKVFLSPNYFFSILILIYATVSIFVTRRSFYKTNSREIFFFILFLSSLFFYAAKPIIIICELLNTPSIYIMFFSRCAFFGKIFGIAALFLSALFSSDLEITKLDTPIILMSVLSYAISASIPLSDNVLANGYFRPAFFNYFMFSLFFMNILIILIFIINFFQKGSKEYLFLSLSVFMIGAGNELLFFSSSTLYFIIGFIFMISGTAFFSHKLCNIYKWY